MNPKPTMPATPAQGSANGSSPTAVPDRFTARDTCEIDYVDELRVQRARQAMPDDETVATLTDTFKSLGDPTRLRIVAALAAPGVDELCVCDLATLLGASSSAVSHSLRALRHLRLVRFRRQGKIAYYRLDDLHVAGLIAEGVDHATAGRLGRGTPARVG